jgi:ABC-2 type transport system ATP-binding protein
MLGCLELTKRFGKRVAVDAVDLSVAQGEAYGLLGPNGAGKTTLVSMVCGLLRPDGGRITIAGRDASSAPRAARAHLGFVPQEVALYPELTARENLRFFGELYGLHGGALRHRVERALEIVQLRDRGGERIGAFSGGMRRRTNIAAALLHEPRLLVLDEPTVGVDPQSRNAILETLENLLDEGVAVLYASHHFDEVERLCDRVGILDGGQIRAEGPTDELLRGANGRQLVEATVASTGGRPEAAGSRFATALSRRRCVGDIAVVDRMVRFTLDGTMDGVELLARVAPTAKVALTNVHITPPDLESVFLELTGRALRE